MLQRSRRGEKRVKPCKYHRKKSTYISLKLGREGSPCYLTHITTQCLNASEQKWSAQTCCCHRIEATSEADKFLRILLLTGLWALLQRMQYTGTANCTKCHQQSMSVAQHMRNSYCRDLRISPATEDSARPCWFSNLISFKNIYHF